MKFDFLYHSYTLIITVFAAVFGMAYPLILQAIERIDTKYASSVLATDLRKRWQFKLFNYLIVTCILSVLVLAYVLEYTDSLQLKYVIVSIAAFFIATLMVDVVLLVQQIITYYSPEDLFNKLNKGTKNNKDANALLDLAKFAAKADAFELHVNALCAISQLFYEEQQKASDDKPVEYSPELYDILSKIAKKVGNTSQTDDRYNYIGIVSTVLNYDSKGGISPSTYMRLWEMVNRAAKAGNTGWFIDYWTYADQYYRFYKLEGHTPLAQDNLKEFYQYHVVMGGLLLYYKRTEWLSHIMHFSQSQPAKFELVPGTLSRIFEMVFWVDELSDKPFGLYAKYQFMGLERGAKIDNAIAGYVYQYLALLIIRLWSYNDYNINYANPLSIPMADDYSIEKNEHLIDGAKRMKKEVGNWCDNRMVSEFSLYTLPSKNEVLDKLDEFIVVLNQKIKEIEARDIVDEQKAKVIKDEIIVTNVNSHTTIPMIEDASALDESLYQKLSTVVKAEDTIEKRYITKGSKYQLGNFGMALVRTLNFYMLSEYLRIVNKLMPCTVSYSISQKDLLEAIDRLELPEDYIILDNGEALDLYEIRQKLTYEDNRCLYNGHEILSFGISGYSAYLLVMPKTDLPLVEIIDTNTQNGDCKLIDANNYLYSNIENLKPPYIVQLVQSMRVYAMKEFGKIGMLKVEYDYGGNRFDIDNIKELCPKVSPEKTEEEEPGNKNEQ